MAVKATPARNPMIAVVQCHEGGKPRRSPRGTDSDLIDSASEIARG